MKITLISVGKIKEKFYRDAIAEYSKRLSGYVKLSVEEVADEKTPDGAGEAAEELIREKEGERIRAKLDKCRGAFVIALAIDGNTYDSVGLSDKIEKLQTSGVSHIVFIIGGSLGLSDNILKAADERLSFSRLTFPHQLMRVILLEQIYRSYRIMNNEPYHK
jgi:23S rRNA (pseudouridine1915-N3)-methyltransferase